ncbi:hypothetical protein COV06_00770 [Candidatus Uhrbacteria bacterium CG10_big_fil_rev_8_21_14_0_10_50_16]|uniref:Uncharacterized protein n=1 Tax=Candidatus Uhrbacteria bacterium CG10_big_fil_rev_8_21_14_0_10_50_16 TaxID=1975039 RepID=A0A2H0RN66_9BACT|nr:MAG: hypothetical protein COV06_00770 [Candidatus Uhrbacteria bacterium CG10_big_fil_rev_8_21_14_0_10_50_16]
MTKMVREALRRAERIQGIATDSRAEIPMGWEDALAGLVDDLMVAIFRQCGVRDADALTDDQLGEPLDEDSSLAFDALVTHGQKVTPSRLSLLSAPIRPPRGWRP